MKFDVCDSVSARPRVCSYEEFRSICKSEGVASLIARYRAGEAEAKRRLPAFCFHASYGGAARTSKNARPSGLYICDFDHLTPEELEDIVRKAVPQATGTQSPVRLVHVTPSGHGVRLVCKAVRSAPFGGCRSIADFQRVMAEMVGAADKLDGVTTDLARLSFAPQWADIRFIDSRLWVEEPEVTDFASSAGAAAAQQEPASLFSSNASQQDYKGIPLGELFEMYFSLRGGLPSEGERNAVYYRAARDLRYICDFNPQVLAAFMPPVGLPPQEVLAVCRSACESSRAAQSPGVIEDVLAACQVAREAEQQEEQQEQQEAQSDKAAFASRLPKLLREVVGLQPPAFQPAALLALLPVVGTLSTRLRAVYLDGTEHSPSFMTMLCAEQASGKSFVRRMVQLLLRSIREEDAAQREIEKAYRLELRSKKNAKTQPVDPRCKVRLVPASISVAKLLQRLDYSEGDHLFSFAEELDTVIKSNRAGAWSEKSDIYRNAFDNSEYGQDYMSDTSWSSVCRVYYNLLLLGTPRQLRRFFNDCENGLVSRFCFASLPDQFGESMPVCRQLTAHQQALLDKRIVQLRTASGLVSLDFVNTALANWLEEQRQQAIRECNRARDILRRRSAVIGFRAALSIAPLYKTPGSSSYVLSDFACLVATEVLKGQLAFFGTELNATLNKEERTEQPAFNLLDRMGDTFTVADLQVQMRKAGFSSPAKTYLYRWRKNGYVRKEGKEYVKIKPQANGN